jgi:hypothetical protein
MSDKLKEIVTGTDLIFNTIKSRILGRYEDKTAKSLSQLQIRVYRYNDRNSIDSIDIALNDIQSLLRRLPSWNREENYADGLLEIKKTFHKLTANRAIRRSTMGLQIRYAEIERDSPDLLKYMPNRKTRSLYNIIRDFENFLDGEIKNKIPNLRDVEVRKNESDERSEDNPEDARVEIERIRSLIPEQRPAPARFIIDDKKIKIDRSANIVNKQDQSNVVYSRQYLVDLGTEVLSQMPLANCDARFIDSISQIHSKICEDANIINIGLSIIPIVSMISKFEQ